MSRRSLTPLPRWQRSRTISLSGTTRESLIKSEALHPHFERKMTLPEILASADFSLADRRRAFRDVFKVLDTAGEVLDLSRHRLNPELFTGMEYQVTC